MAEGVVKVLLGERWYDVCDDMWDDTDAKIVCKQLGYTGNFSRKNLWGELRKYLWMSYRLSSGFTRFNRSTSVVQEKWA